jgi:hypothetical protein
MLLLSGARTLPRFVIIGPLTTELMGKLLPASQRVRTLIVGLALAMIFIRFFAVGLFAIEANWNSQRVDQGRYLQLGLNLHAPQAAGVVTQDSDFPASMSSFGEVPGLISDGNRNPLYPLLISIFAQRSWSYFTGAKLLSLITGALVLVVFFWFARRQFGVGVALVATALLSINTQFLQHVSMAMAEPLLMLFFILSWAFIVRGFRRWTDWIIAGVFAGLAYWTKGTASGLLLAFVITIAIIRGKAALRNRNWLVFPLVFLALLAPLWVYNTIHFGHPFYNFNYTHALWLDNWYQVHAAKLATLPTMSTYLQSHSLGEMLLREWTGIVLTKNLGGYSLMPWGWESNFQRRYVAWALIGIVALLSVFHRRVWNYIVKRPAVMISGIALIIVTIMPLSWFFPISPNPRFFLPVLPIVLLFLVVGCRGLLNSLLERLGTTGQRLQDHTLPITGVTLIVLLGILTIWPMQHTQANPFEVDRTKNAYTDQVLAWLSEGVEEKTTVLFGTSHALPLWKYSDSFDFLTVPSDITDWEELLEYVKQKNARYIIVDFETLLSRLPLMSRYFDVDQRQVEMTQMPPGSALAYVLDQLPANFLVFEVLGANTIEHPLDVQFGDDIDLIGYTMQQSTVEPGQTVSLTLYWRSRSEIAQDITVFTHLLDPTGFLRGQIDRQPLRSALPTSMWQPDMVIADRYDIAVSEDAPPGEYLIACGVYTLEDMHRLQATSPEGNLPDNQLLIAGPAIETRTAP